MARWHHRNGAIKEPSRPMNGDHIVIIGPYGNIWHDGSFPTAEEAEKYLRTFWVGSAFHPSEWRLACASVTMEAFEPSFQLPSAIADGTATAAANEDLPVPQDCQARAESIARTPLPYRHPKAVTHD